MLGRLLRFDQRVYTWHMPQMSDDHEQWNECMRWTYDFHTRQLAALDGVCLQDSIAHSIYEERPFRRRVTILPYLHKLATVVQRVFFDVVNGLALAHQVPHAP